MYKQYTKNKAFLIVNSIRLTVYRKTKICKQKNYKAILSVQDVDLVKYQLTMFSSNIHRQSRFGLSRRFHHIHIFFFLQRFSRIWIIYIGRCLYPQKIINSLGLYGIFEKDETTKILTTLILTLEILSSWYKLSHCFGQKLMPHSLRGSPKLVSWK